MAMINSSNPVVRRALNDYPMLMSFDWGKHKSPKYKVGQEVYYKWGPFQCLGTVEKISGYKYKVKDRTTNQPRDITYDDIVYATNSAVAKNARASVLVSFNAITAKGIEKVQAKMSADDFEAWAKKVGVESSLQSVWLSLMKGEEARVIAPPVRISVKEI